MHLAHLTAEAVKSPDHLIAALLHETKKNLAELSRREWRALRDAATRTDAVGHTPRHRAPKVPCVAYPTTSRRTQPTKSPTDVPNCGTRIIFFHFVPQRNPPLCLPAEIFEPSLQSSLTHAPTNLTMKNLLECVHQSFQKNNMARNGAETEDAKNFQAQDFSENPYHDTWHSKCSASPIPSHHRNPKPQNHQPTFRIAGPESFFSFPTETPTPCSAPSFRGRAGGIFTCVIGRRARR